MFHHQVATPFCYFRTKRCGNIPMGTRLTGASNAGGVGTNLDAGRIGGYRSMTAGRASTKCNTLSCDGPWRVDDTRSVVSGGVC